MEVWEDIKDYEGLYKVSDLGRVKGLKRNSILKSNIDYYGYVRVKLCKNGKTQTKKVHKLVAVSFLNHLESGQKEVVDHIDNNKLNNSLENLQLTTARHNTSKDRTNGSSKYTGVSWCKRLSKWKVGITTNGKSKHLGYFSNEKKAGLIYQKELLKIGEDVFQIIN